MGSVPLAPVGRSCGLAKGCFTKDMCPSPTVKMAVGVLGVSENLPAAAPGVVSFLPDFWGRETLGKWAEFLT